MAMATKEPRRSADRLVADQLRKNAEELEKAMDAHVLTWYGPIQPPSDQLIKQAVEYRAKQPRRKRRLAMVLQTPGGYIETAEKISHTLRHHYSWIAFMVPDMAMSAGTVLALSGDELWMDYSSYLGPIDPQVEKVRPDGRKGLIPALGYLIKYDELVKKSQFGTLTSVEAAFFVQNFDAAELYYYEQAKKLSIALLKEWLVRYKFKNWKITQTRKMKVTLKMRKQRAEEIGVRLSNTEQWLSHNRGISMHVLRRDINLKVEDIESRPDVDIALDNYYALLTNYLQTIGADGAMHTGGMFLPLMIQGV